MKACVQHLAGVIRVGPETDTWGEPWDYCATYAATGPDTVTLMAIKGDGKLTRAHVRAAVAAAKAMGFTTVIWERHKGEIHRVVEGK